MISLILLILLLLSARRMPLKEFEKNFSYLVKKKIETPFPRSLKLWFPIEHIIPQVIPEPERWICLLPYFSQG